MPTITLHRSQAFRDAYRDYRIILDGAEVGRLPRGGTLEIPSSAGPHTLSARIDWQSSDELQFELSERPLEFEVFSKLTGLRILLTIIYIFVPRSWIGVRLIPDTSTTAPIQSR
jgi:hypothetical protein